MLRRYVVVAVLLIVGGLTVTASMPSPGIQQSQAVTFHKEVLPILQNNCQSCEARPWARAIKTAVISKKMPPRFADPKFGHFANDRSFKASDIDIISRWADGEAVEENPKATFLEDAEFVWMFPHMHVRGTEMTYKLIFPDGRTETVLSVPKGAIKLWQSHLTSCTKTSTQR